MTDEPSNKVKIAKPSLYFEKPGDVVTDAKLSADQKSAVLKTLEQDSRQMLDAASEGMGGGEPNKLHEVLTASDSLSLQPVADAYATVLQDLRRRRDGGAADASAGLARRAISALAPLAALFSNASEAAAAVVPVAVVRPL
jgi:hypothetical protein